MTEEALPVQPEQPPDIGPGAMLAQARVQRQLSIAEVAERLKYGAKQIEALEADDYAHLPGTTFVRGMMRGYARLVAIDPEPVLKALERRTIPAQVTVDLRPQRIPFPDGSKRGTRLYLTLSLVALVAIAGVLYEWHLADSEPAPTMRPAAVAAAPQVAQVVEATTSDAQGGARMPSAQDASDNSASAGAGIGGATPRTGPSSTPARAGGRIQLSFQKQSWVEVRDRNGQVLFSQLNPPGTQQTVEGAPPLAIIIGNAAGVRLIYNDAPVDLKPYVKIEVARLTLE